MFSDDARMENLRKARALHVGAYQRLWDQLESAPPDRCTLFDYDLVAFVKKAPWRLMFAGDIVSSELREATNIMNRWILDTAHWQIWLKVLDEYRDDQERWALRFEFIEPIAHRAMISPSHVRDVLGRIATNVAHQGNMSLAPNAKDELPEDEALFKGRFISRQRVEKQLHDVANRWKGFTKFEERLLAMNGDMYLRQTRDYRNRSSHSIPPNFEFGDVQIWTRSVQNPEIIIKNKDGTSTMHKDLSRRVAGYGFGGIAPLNLSEAWRYCHAELDLARNTFDAYRNWLIEIVDELFQANAKRDRGSTTTPVL